MWVKSGNYCVVLVDKLRNPQDMKSVYYWHLNQQVVPCFNSCVPT